MQAGERQGARIRQRYLGAVLKQEVSFFDTDASSGEIVSRVSSDVLLIQDAISEKVRGRGRPGHSSAGLMSFTLMLCLVAVHHPSSCASP